MSLNKSHSEEYLELMGHNYVGFANSKNNTTDDISPHYEISIDDDNISSHNFLDTTSINLSNSAYSRIYKYFLNMTSCFKRKSIDA